MRSRTSPDGSTTQPGRDLFDRLRRESGPSRTPRTGARAPRGRSGPREAAGSRGRRARGRARRLPANAPRTPPRRACGRPCWSAARRAPRSAGPASASGRPESARRTAVGGARSRPRRGSRCVLPLHLEAAADPFEARRATARSPRREAEAARERRSRPGRCAGCECRPGARRGVPAARPGLQRA